MPTVLTYPAFLASARAIPNLYGAHVEFPADDAPDTPLPAVLFAGDGDDPCAPYVFAPSGGCPNHTLLIGNWQQEGTLEECAASLYAWYAHEQFAGRVPPDIAAQMPESAYGRLLP